MIVNDRTNSKVRWWLQLKSVGSTLFSKFVAEFWNKF